MQDNYPYNPRTTRSLSEKSDYELLTMSARTNFKMSEKLVNSTFYQLSI